MVTQHQQGTCEVEVRERRRFDVDTSLQGEGESWVKSSKQLKKKEEEEEEKKKKKKKDWC